MTATDNTINRADALARDVLMLSRNTLLVNLRFLDAALSQFTTQAHPNGIIATDGQMLYYDALHVLQAYREEHAAPARHYLHLVLHCVFRHMFHHKEVEPVLWDLACDIAVEHAITGFGLNAITVERELKQRKVTVQLQSEIGMLTAEKLYRYLSSHEFRMGELEEIQKLFLADDHSFWHGRDGAPTSPQSPAEIEAIWQDISQRMQVDMETFARRQGDKAEAMMQNLRESNRETYDYSGFLQKFAARGESMKTSADEFDFIFYTYGMQLYEKMPLIEPLEYKEIKHVRDFVVAVDLTGLLSVEQAEKFLLKTFEVLKTTETSAVKVVLHILTCAGTEAPEYTRVTTAEEFENYLSTLKPRKSGESDYRPLFLKVDDMVRGKEFKNLKGVLCLTDGYGPFPPRKPGYDAVFVFVNDNYSKPDVPPWAVRLVVQKDEIE